MLYRFGTMWGWVNNDRNFSLTSFDSKHFISLLPSPGMDVPPVSLKYVPTFLRISSPILDVCSIIMRDILSCGEMGERFHWEICLAPGTTFRVSHSQRIHLYYKNIMGLKWFHLTQGRWFDLEVSIVSVSWSERLWIFWLGLVKVLLSDDSPG